MQFITYPFRWMVAKFDQRRLNKWLYLRLEGKSNEVALKAAWLSPERTLRLLDNCLYGNMATVGIMTLSKGTFSSSMDQTELLFKALAYIHSALCYPQQKKLVEWFETMLDHNWGYVRRSATTALKIIKTDSAS